MATRRQLNDQSPSPSSFLSPLLPHFPLFSPATYEENTSPLFLTSSSILSPSLHLLPSNDITYIWYTAACDKLVTPCSLSLPSPLSSTVSPLPAASWVHTDKIVPHTMDAPQNKVRVIGGMLSPYITLHHPCTSFRRQVVVCHALPVFHSAHFTPLVHVIWRRLSPLLTQFRTPQLALHFALLDQSKTYYSSRIL